MLRLVTFMLIVATAGLGLSSPTALAASPDTTASFDIRMQTDGGVGVRESITLPAAKVEDSMSRTLVLGSEVAITEIHVAESGTAYADISARGRFIRQAGTFFVEEISTGHRITWYPTAAKNSKRSFEITYQLSDFAQAYDDGIVLRYSLWNAWKHGPVKLDVSFQPSANISESKLRAWLDPLGIKSTTSYDTSTINVVTVSAPVVKQGQVARFTAVVPRSALQTTGNARNRIGKHAKEVIADELDARKDFANQTADGIKSHPWAFLMALFGFGIGPAVIVVVIIDRLVRPVVKSTRPVVVNPDHRFELPTEQSPAEVGILLGIHQSHPGRLFVAVVLDLVRRGMLTAVPIRMTRWDSKNTDTEVESADYRIGIGTKANQLSKVEQVVFEFVKAQVNDEVNLLREIVDRSTSETLEKLHKALALDEAPVKRRDRKLGDSMQRLVRAQIVTAGGALASAIIAGILVLALNPSSLSAKATVLSLSIGLLLVASACIVYSIRLQRWHEAAAQFDAKRDRWEQLCDNMCAESSDLPVMRLSAAYWERVVVTAVIAGCADKVLLIAADKLKDRDVSGSALFADGCAIAGGRTVEPLPIDAISATIDSRTRELQLIDA